MNARGTTASNASSRDTTSTVEHHIASEFFDHDYSVDEGEYQRAQQFASSSSSANFLKWSLWFNFALCVSDFIVLVVTAQSVFALSSYSARNELGLPNSLMSTINPDLLLDIILGMIWCFSLLICGTYRRHLMGEGYDLYSLILQGMVIFLVLASAGGFLFHLSFPRWRLLVIVVLGCLFTAIERRVWRGILHHFRRQGRMSYPVTVVGTWEGIHRALKDIDLNVGLGYLPIAVAPVIFRDGLTVPDVNSPHLLTITVHSRSENRGARKIPVLTFNSHLPATAKKLGCQVIFLVDGIPRGSRTYSAFSLAAQASGMEMSVPVVSTADVNNGFVFSLHNTSDTMPVLTSSIPQFNVVRRVNKRIFDIILSLIGIILSAIPMIVTAIAIKIDDGGPVFYLQRRVGQYGRPFTIYKFRSMRVDADKMDAQLAQDAGVKHQALFKLKNDPRITRVGSFIRKTSIDELPQFFNVLIGNMSMVGPRPQQAYERDQYDSVYSTRLLAKPGLTGPWQISGRSDLSEKQAEQLDVFYVAHNSLAGDAVIILKTIPVLLNHRGAY